MTPGANQPESLQCAPTVHPTIGASEGMKILSSAERKNGGDRLWTCHQSNKNGISKNKTKTRNKMQHSNYISLLSEEMHKTQHYSLRIQRKTFRPPGVFHELPAPEIHTTEGSQFYSDGSPFTTFWPIRNLRPQQPNCLPHRKIHWMLPTHFQPFSSSGLTRLMAMAPCLNVQCSMGRNRLFIVARLVGSVRQG